MSEIDFHPTPGPVLRRAAALRDRFREWAPTTYGSGDYPEREMQALREGGFFTVTLPGEPLAQAGKHTPALLRLLTAVGEGNLAAGRIYEGHINALHLVMLYGTEEQVRRWSADARAGHLFGVWNTEMSDGVHFDPEDNGVRVKGSKSFCSGSLRVTRPLITGQLAGEDGGWQMAIVPLDRYQPAVDVSFWSPLGMQNTVSHKIDFTGIGLDANDLLGRPGDYNRQPWISGGAVRFAAVQLGGLAALLHAVGEFLRQSGRTADAHQRRRVAQMHIDLESGKLWLDRAGAEIDYGSQIVHYANMARTSVGDYCERGIHRAQQCVGARGLLHPNPVARLCTDLSMYLRQPAPDAALDAVGQHYLDDES